MPRSRSPSPNPRPRDSSAYEDPHLWGFLTTNIRLFNRTEPTRHYVYMHSSWVPNNDTPAHIFLYQDADGTRNARVRDHGPFDLPAPGQERYPQVMELEYASTLRRDIVQVGLFLTACAVVPVVLVVMAHVISWYI